jgi:DNA primase
MALPASFLDELRARTPLAPLIGRKIKMARSGRQWKGCCPFHDEKSPSFYVYEDGFHCFGCGAHGDAIGFVMRTEGASFPEAVGRLAAEAGLEVPKPTPEAAAAEQRRLDLHGVLEAACALFQRRLRAVGGASALAYLRGRGLTDATIEAFAVGWSGEGRALEAELGVPAKLLADAGLMTETADGRPRALFFDRVTFPIRDAQGRVIGFGGRTLGDGQPKYLNGPETALFSKRRTLFGLDRARAVARTGGDVIVVEGYLDVIALHQAGFTGAVAPLGTALTEAQLELLWRLSPAPKLCFDGDAAGARAAERAVLLALPMLVPACTFSVARLPAGEDPDSFVRSGGAEAFRTALQAPELWESLYDILRKGAKTPEQLAAFRDRLQAAAKTIRHPALASEYRRAMLDRFFAERRRPQATRPPLAVGRPLPSGPDSDLRRGRILICLLLNHPAVLHDEEETVARLELPADLEALRRAMLEWLLGAENLEAAALMDHLRTLGQAEAARGLLASVSTDLPNEARATATRAEAVDAFRHFAGLLRRPALERELAQATQAMADRFDEAAMRRMKALRDEQARLYAAGPPAN